MDPSLFMDETSSIRSFQEQQKGERETEWNREKKRERERKREWKTFQCN